MALGIAAAAGGTAQAAVYRTGWACYDTRDGGVGLRTGPSQAYTLLGRGYSDQHAWVRGWVSNGQLINGNPYWNYDDHYLADWTYWKTVWSADSYMYSC